MTLSLSISLYLSLPPKQKKIVQQIYHNQKTNNISFLKGKSLCKKANCSKETRKRMKRKNKDLNNLMFECTPRFDKNGRQTTDKYVLTSDFKKALAWIEVCYGLNVSKRKHKKMISHIENEEKCAPPPLQNVPPLVKINLSRDRFKRTPQTPLKKEYIHPKIALVKIPKEDQIMLSKYPEAWIMWGLENTLYAYRKGCKIEKPTDFLWANIRMAEKRIKR